MLLSEFEERGRRFKLALRAGIPILLLISLVFYASLFKSDSIYFTPANLILLGAIVFATIYFIYFLLEQDAQETLLDQETHGFNQRAFEKKLKSSNSKTIALLTIDNLSLIDENYGTKETNRLLYHIIQRLDYTLEEEGLNNALIGRRYGSDFLIAIDKKSDELKSAIKQFIADNHTVNDIDISYQYSLMTYKNEDLEKAISYLKANLTKQTDEKNSKLVSSEKDIPDLDNLVKLEDEISNSIEEKRLLFMFRPLQNTSNGKTDIYEVSVKLKTDTSGDILPRVFLPIVNRLGLGRKYDFAIIEHIIKLLPLIDDKISFTFNISPFSMRNKEFQDKLFVLLDDSKIDASRLIIELYERKAHHNLSTYFQTLGYLRSKGLKIALDNFGSSNASMEYMKHFRFDMVQFDREYVTKLDRDNTKEMLKSLITMSKNLGITTVAKWVDNDEQKKRLKNLGIDYVQGFGVGKAISEKELINIFNQRS